MDCGVCSTHNAVCCNSIANALELHLSCTNPSKWSAICPRKHAHGRRLCVAVISYRTILTLSFMFTSLILGQPCGCLSFSETTLKIWVNILHESARNSFYKKERNRVNNPLYIYIPIKTSNCQDLWHLVQQLRYLGISPSGFINPHLDFVDALFIAHI